MTRLSSLISRLSGLGDILSLLQVLRGADRVPAVLQGPGQGQPDLQGLPGGQYEGTSGRHSFNFYFQWCETQRDCNRLRLIDILVRPMQRLTKYSLLLKAVLKKTDDSNQKKDLVEMVHNISLKLFLAQLISNLGQTCRVTGSGRK